MKIVIDIDDEMVCNDIKCKALEPTSATDEVIINALYNGAPYEERPSGEWIEKVERRGCFAGDKTVYSYTCPFCGAKEFKKYPFCHCGADMRGKENE